MPTYEYECPRCGIFELFQQITAEALERCPSCQSKVRRLIGGGGGLLFKGSGFYTTDYRSEEYKRKAKSEQKSAEPPKPASKPDKGGTASTPSKAGGEAAGKGTK